MRITKRNGRGFIFGLVGALVSLPGVTGAQQADAKLPQQIASCHGGDVAACNSVGVAFDNAGLAGEAVPYFRKVCDGGELVGCSNLGELYFDGRGVTRDRARALQLFKSACIDSRRFSGCAGVCVVGNAEGSLTSDLNSTCARIVQASCDNGNSWMCGHAASFRTRRLLTPPPRPAAPVEQTSRGGCSDGSASLIGRAYYLSHPLGSPSELESFISENRTAFQRGGPAIACANALGTHLVKSGLAAYDPKAYERAMRVGPAEDAPEVASSINSGAVDLFAMGNELVWLGQVLPSAANGDWRPYNSTGTELRTTLRGAVNMLRQNGGPDMAEALGMTRELLKAFAPIADQQILMLSRMMPR